MRNVERNIVRAVSFATGRNEAIAKAYLRKIRGWLSKKHRSGEVDLIKRYLKMIGKNDGILLDVGAHVGSFCDSFLWGKWTVYAFEPDPDPDKVRALNMLSARKNVHYINKACSNKSGEKIPFYASRESTGISSLHAFHPTHRAVGHVETITLAEFIASEGNTDVRVLKVDTEGHDLFVLEGFPWGKIKPAVVFCEFEDRKTLALGYDFRRMGEFLQDNGYRVFASEWYPIVKYGEKHRWRAMKSFPCALDDPAAMGNFFCFRQEDWKEEYADGILRFKVD